MQKGHQVHTHTYSVLFRWDMKTDTYVATIPNAEKTTALPPADKRVAQDTDVEAHFTLQRDEESLKKGDLCVWYAGQMRVRLPRTLHAGLDYSAALDEDGMPLRVFSTQFRIDPQLLPESDLPSLALTFFQEWWIACGRKAVPVLLKDLLAPTTDHAQLIASLHDAFPGVVTPRKGIDARHLGNILRGYAAKSSSSEHEYPFRLKTTGPAARSGAKRWVLSMLHEVERH